MINELPTVYEVVTGSAKQSKDSARSNGNKSKPNGNKANILFLNSRLLITFVIYLDPFVLSFGSIEHSNLIQKQRRLLHPMKRARVMGMRKKNREQLVVLVEIIMRLMNSGFAVMCVRDGFMGNV